VLDTPVQVAETACAAVSGGLCHFVVSPDHT
jgi:predicted hydrocarbon binding protein